jgi:two-component system, OmpR family, heavy metal sensor histidine kinase CusS
LSAADPAVPGRAWSLATRLTLLGTASAFGLLLAAALFLNWELGRNVQRDAEDRLHHKLQVLARLLAESPPNLVGIRQEAQEEAEVSSESEFPFFLRVLDANGHEIVASSDMARSLPISAFVGDHEGRPRQWTGPKGTRYLLSAITISSADKGRIWILHAAFDVSASERFLARFRADLLLMLLVGLLAAAALGAWAVRRGLRPLREIASHMEPIGAAELGRRLTPVSWPVELASVAGAFDHVLDRLQESFHRLQQFSADLAHELRTPINTLMGEAQVALSRPRASADYERVLQSSLEELARLARMIDSMLFLAQADQARTALDPSRLQAAEELRAIADFYDALADEHGVRVRVIGDTLIFADPLLLRRALSNLLSNALRHTPRGGEIELRVVERPGGTDLIIKDTGSGISTEHLAKLGDRFYRVEPSRSGTDSGYGLGLAIVRSILSLHQGTMRIDTAPGRGTSVILFFPDGPTQGGRSG